MISEMKRRMKPVQLYIQDMIIRSELLDGLKLDTRRCAVNEDTRNAHAFSKKIYRIYDGYKADMAKRTAEESLRWKHMRECLKEAGKNPDVRDQVELAKELGIHKNMVSDALLMSDGHRAGIDAVCLALMGLGCLHPEKVGMAQEENGDSERSPRLVRALESRELAEALRRYFAGGVPLEKQVADAEKGKSVTQEESAAARVKREKICRIAAPFGYWLPDKKDEEERKARIDGTREAALTLVKIKTQEEEQAKQKEEQAKPKKEAEKKESFITEIQKKYLWLKRGQIETLHDPRGSWSENPNRLHLIIASCSADACAAEIEKAYHAFSLHPFGLNPGDRKGKENDKQDGGALNCLKPFFPVDQVVVASIETFRPLLECVMKREKSFWLSTTAFWGLLFVLLNHCDRDMPERFRLCSRLFSFRSLKGDELDLEAMLQYWSEFRQKQIALELAGEEGEA